MLEMTENDIFVHWKTAKSRKYEINVLAELNGTTPAKIREIIVKMGKKAGEDVSEIEDVATEKEELAKQKKREWQREYERKKRARKKAEAEEAPDPLEVVDPDELPEETEPDNGDNDELIKKAVQYFSADLAEAIYEQRLKVEEEKSKLRKMEDDLERCKRILGFGKEAEKDDK